MERGDEGVVWLEKLTACLSKQSALEGCAIALAMCSGSVAFNLNLASSDEDLFGVYLVPTFSPSFKRSVAGHSPTDYEVHELEEYLLLLEKGNPKVSLLSWICGLCFDEIPAKGC
jgi:predicted nucleotidyltransferase